MEIKGASEMNGNHTMKYSEGSAGCAGLVDKESPFRSLASAVEQLADARGMMARLADRIAGQEPPQGTEASKDPVGHCLIDEVDNAATTIRRLTSRIFEDINRIERRL